MTAGDPDRAPIPYGRHEIDDDDVAAVVEVLRHGWLTQGPQVGGFENDLAERCGARHAVAVNSGTPLCIWPCSPPASARETRSSRRR